MLAPHPDRRRQVRLFTCRFFFFKQNTFLWRTPQNSKKKNTAAWWRGTPEACPMVWLFLSFTVPQESIEPNRCPLLSRTSPFDCTSPNLLYHRLLTSPLLLICPRVWLLASCTSPVHVMRPRTWLLRSYSLPLESIFATTWLLLFKKSKNPILSICSDCHFPLQRYCFWMEYDLKWWWN